MTQELYPQKFTMAPARHIIRGGRSEMIDWQICCACDETVSIQLLYDFCTFLLYISSNRSQKHPFAQAEFNLSDVKQEVCGGDQYITMKQIKTT
jgi:hypothetical protein